MPESPPPSLMSLRQYAKRRGVSAMSVSVAAKHGRLKASIVRDQDGRVMGILDPVLADQEWAANTDVAKAPPKEQEKAAIREALLSGSPVMPVETEGGLPTLANAAARSKHWEAETKELKYREAAGELVRAADVEAKLADVFTHCKTRLLAIPSRAKQAIPELSLEQLAILDGLVREALEDLAAPAMASAEVAE